MSISVQPVVMAGGSGTRLWPLSRAGYPKQFLVLSGNSSLFQQAAARLATLAETGTTVAAPLIVGNEEHRFLVLDQLREIGVEPAAVVLEPMGRNTAPAVAVAAHLVQARYGADAVMLVLAADHLIRNDDAFGWAAGRAAELARDGKLVTFGITPTLPETGFGYVECGAPLGERAYAAARFVEKPVLAKAQEYLAAGNYVWNAGMFAFTPAAILSALERYAPAIAARWSRQCWPGGRRGRSRLSFLPRVPPAAQR